MLALVNEAVTWVAIWQVLKEPNNCWAVVLKVPFHEAEEATLHEHVCVAQEKHVEGFYPIVVCSQRDLLVRSLKDKEMDLPHRIEKIQKVKDSFVLNLHKLSIKWGKNQSLNITLS